MPKHRKTHPRRAFTLVELLVAIGIIILLIGLLIPVVSHVRRTAHAANTQAQLAAIAGAIDRYHNDFSAYPGPLSNTDVRDTADVAGIQNLVLGLLGGVNPAGDFDVNYVGRGPFSLAPRRQFPPYLDDAGAGLTRITDNPPPIPFDLRDRFPDPMPIIYLRANRGRTNAFSNGSMNGQYDFALVGNGNDPRTVAGTSETVTYSTFQTQLTHPTMPGTPRARDAYILISPGHDREYFTTNDIRYPPG